MKRFVMVAVSVLGLCVAMNTTALQAQTAKKAAKTMTATGSVKTVSGASLTITAAAGKEMTFAIDASTRFIGKGLGTKAKSGAMTAADAVAMSDEVTVRYHDMGGSMHAASVTVTHKAMVKK